jgi:hypothetical protein
MNTSFAEMINAKLYFIVCVVLACIILTDSYLNHVCFRMTVHMHL